MSRLPKIRLLTVYYWLILLLMFSPLVVLVLFSFNNSTVMSFPLSGFTLKWFSQVFHNATLLSAFRNSALMALVCALIATLLATLGAAAVAWYKFPGKNLFVGMSVLPIVFPAVLIGVAMLLAFHMLNVPLSLWTVGLGEIVICLPEAMLIIVARLAGMSRSLEEASMDLGATYIRTHLLITLPIVAPAVAAAALVAFILVLNEFALAFFLTGTQPILPVYMFSMLRQISSAPVVTAAGSLIIFASLFIIAFTQVLAVPNRRRHARATESDLEAEVQVSAKA
jgi:spermidine/putrescine transport system permease protein